MNSTVVEVVRRGRPTSRRFSHRRFSRPASWLTNLERAGAVRVQCSVVRGGVGSRGDLDRVVGLGRPLLVHDVERVPLVVQDRVRTGEDKVDGVVVDDLDFGIGPERGWSDQNLQSGRGRQRKATSSAVKVVAVVELDALAQVEAPAVRLDNFPTLGKARLDLPGLRRGGSDLHMCCQVTDSVKVSLRLYGSRAFNVP